MDGETRSRSPSRHVLGARDHRSQADPQLTAGAESEHRPNMCAWSDARRSTTSRTRRAWRPPPCRGPTRVPGGSTPTRRERSSRPPSASATAPTGSTVSSPATARRGRPSAWSSPTSPTRSTATSSRAPTRPRGEAGYQLILSHTNESPEVERETIERELDQVDGIVLASSRMTDSALRMMAKQKPVVLLNRIIPEACCVVSDNARGIRRAVEHLGALGHDADHLRGRAGDELGRRRALAGVARGGGRARAARRGASARTRPDRAGRAERGAAGRPRSSATAVLAYNDPLAIGVMKGLRKLGVAGARRRERGRASTTSLLRRAGRAGADHRRVAAVPDGVHRRAELHRGAARAPGPAVRRCRCRSTSSCASRPLSAGGRAPRRRAARPTSPGRPRRPRRRPSPGRR